MYVDGFVLVVPTKNRAAYKKIAQRAGEMWMKLGALEYRECFGDDLSNDMGASFPTITAARRSDTVVFSWISYKDKKHRDAVNAKVMQDPWMIEMMKPGKMPFDTKRMSYGGFETVVEFTASKAKAPAKAAKSAKKKAR